MYYLFILDVNNVPYPMEPDMVECVNEALEECWHLQTMDGFNQFMYYVTGESVPVDFMHTDTRMTALMIAAAKGCLKEVQALLSMGANPKLPGPNNMTALQWAIKMGRTDCINYLTYIEQQMLIKNQNISEPTSAYNQMLLEAYQAKTNEDDIDNYLLFSVIRYVHKNMPMGSILVFLPGYDSITEQNEIIQSYMNDGQIDGNLKIFMLHGNMQANDQKQVFAPAEYGCRKIILSTNIAETSLTIDDVVFVIDCGKVKQKTYDALTGATSLTTTWISLACAKQRMGRAGRVQPGVCFRLYSKLRESNMDKFTLPEILRVPLTEISLNAKILAGDASISEFLAKAIQPPPSVSVVQSIRLLKKMGALDANENITELGKHLVDLPVDVQLGKTLLYAVLLKCIDPVLTIVSALSVKDPFVLPGLDGESLTKVSRETFAEGSCSDHMILLKVFQQWNESKSIGQDRQFCRDNYINNGCMQMICGVRAQILGHLRSIGMIQHKSPGSIHELNKNATNWAAIKACLTAGMYPNVCRIDRKQGQLKSRQENKLIPHPSSVLRDKNPKKCQENLRALPTEWILFGEKSRAGRFCLVRYNTVVTPLNIAIFAGPINMNEKSLQTFRDESDSEDEDNVNDQPQELTKFVVDDWISFVVDTETAVYTYHMRQKLNALLLKIIQNPLKYYMNRDSRCIDLIAEILLNEDKKVGFAQPKHVGRRPIAVALQYAPDLNTSHVNSHNRLEQQPGTSKNAMWSAANRNDNRKPVKGIGGRHHIDKSHNNKPQQNKNNNSIRYFIVRAASEKQILQQFEGAKWSWSSSILKQLYSINRVSSTYIEILFTANFYFW